MLRIAGRTMRPERLMRPSLRAKRSNPGPQRKSGLLRSARNDGLCHAEAIHGLSPNFSLSSGNSRSGLNGVDVKRIPVALASALPSAAATGLYGLSLIDLAPIGPSVSHVSAK